MDFQEYKRQSEKEDERECKEFELSQLKRKAEALLYRYGVHTDWDLPREETLDLIRALLDQLP